MKYPAIAEFAAHNDLIARDDEVIFLIIILIF
jgi:hypothetical protein